MTLKDPKIDIRPGVSNRYTGKRPILRDLQTSQFHHIFPPGSHESHGNPQPPTAPTSPSPPPRRTAAPSNSLRLLRPSRTFTWTNVMAQPGRISAVPQGGHRPSKEAPHHLKKGMSVISWHTSNCGCWMLLGQDMFSLQPSDCGENGQIQVPSQHPMADRTGSRRPRSHLATWCRPPQHREPPARGCQTAAARDHPGVPGRPPAMCRGWWLSPWKKELVTKAQESGSMIT